MRRTAASENPHAFHALRRAVIAAALVATALPMGCVRRRLNVRSNPPGAMVFVDNQQIGTTPCSVDFVYYGTREIRLVKPGYETLTVNQPIPTPWYQIPPIDFVSDNLLPNTIQDHRTVAFNLEPQIIVPTEQLIERGNQLRQETMAGVVAAPPASVVVPGAGVPAGAVAPVATPVPTLAPPEMFAPAPAPTLAPTPAPQPSPLPPVNQAPVSQPLSVQPPVTQFPSTQPPYGQTLPPSSIAPSAVSPITLPPTTTAPANAPPANSQSASAPFAPPTLPSIPPAGTQQGPPLVSPPLR